MDEFSFSLNGKPHTVPTVFQIWRKEAHSRSLLERPTTDLFEFVGHAEANFAVKRIGSRAGEIAEDLDRSPSSNYFILSKTPELFRKVLDLADFEEVRSLTAGVPSISKPELIDESNRVLLELGLI